MTPKNYKAIREERITVSKYIITLSTSIIGGIFVISQLMDRPFQDLFLLKFILIILGLSILAGVILQIIDVKIQFNFVSIKSKGDVTFGDFDRMDEDEKDDFFNLWDDVYTKLRFSINVEIFQYISFFIGMAALICFIYKGY
ncbi:MAG: hypothetical protein ABID64_00540 [Nitrospirota bacterium]